jgi:hypothetical protein
MYLVQRPLPQQAWLSSTADIRLQLALAEPGIAELPQLSQHPFADLFPDDRLARMLRLWEERQPLLVRLDQLPHTLCHRDAFRRNLRTRQGATGQPQTVALDWAMTGIGILGEELVRLFALTLRFFTVEIWRIAELDALIFAGYMDGLRAAGWQGDARLVRFGFTAQAALLMGVGEPASRLPNVARRIAALPAGAEPLRMLGPGLAQYIALQHHLLALGDEARMLLAALR